MERERQARRLYSISGYTYSFVIYLRFFLDWQSLYPKGLMSNEGKALKRQIGKERSSIMNRFAPVAGSLTSLTLNSRLAISSQASFFPF